MNPFADLDEKPEPHTVRRHQPGTLDVLLVPAIIAFGAIFGAVAIGYLIVEHNREEQRRADAEIRHEYSMKKIRLEAEYEAKKSAVNYRR